MKSRRPRLHAVSKTVHLEEQVETASSVGSLAMDCEPSGLRRYGGTWGRISFWNGQAEAIRVVSQG